MVRLWLFFVAFLIVVMVLVGGATRLTDSGLSITQWEPIKGFLPPFTAEKWAAEFLEYQETDEFKQVNSRMTMDEFKFIYWWEWGHRFLGRLIGLAVLIPMVAFWIAGRLPGRLKWGALAVFVGVCIQGAIGWWMVKSGLVDRVDVSQVRLAVHLTMACLLLAGVIWLARGLTPEHAPPMPAIAWQGGAVFALVIAQIFAGGLVAGLDAGMAYNTWPDMNGEVLPSGAWAIDPIWKNFTENAVMTQFVHRVTAYLLLAAVVVHLVSVWRARGGVHMMGAAFLVALVVGQAMIGIITLVMQVPLQWALLHQFGGVVVLSVAVVHWRAMAGPSKIVVEAPSHGAAATLQPVHDNA
ncbi:MAG: COX15/CtaA family protein [Pseudomonadota bacterium]